jgi:hypothetical protein
MPRSCLARETSACRIGIVLLTLGMANGLGCALAPWKAMPAASSLASAGTVTTASTAVSQAGTNGQSNMGAAVAPPPSPAAVQSSNVSSNSNSSQDPRPDLQAIDQLVARIAERDGLDEAGRARLTQDLRETDPSLWPALMQAFEAALAYQRQMKNKPQASSGNQAAVSPENRSPTTSEPSAEQVRTIPSGPNRSVAAEVRASGHQGEISQTPLPSETAGEASASFSRRMKGESSAGQAAMLASADRSPPALERNLSHEEHTPERGKPEPPRPPAEGGGSPGVVPVSYASPISGAQEPWLERLDGAVKALEAELRQSPQTTAELARQARLRLLYLASGRREDAMRPIPAASPAMQDSWAQMIYGLAAWMDVERVPDASRRAAEARQQLLAAAQRLGELAPLLVRNASFAKEVKSFGDITPFEKTEFTPGQEVLLYAELENFKSEETPKGFHTQFRGSYEIFDARGQRVTAQELGKTEEYCRNHRRDFFLVYNFRLPKRIYNGRHTLQLTVEDLHGQKIGQTSLEFTVKGSGD